MVIDLVFGSSTLRRDPQTRKVIEAILKSELGVKISLVFGELEKKDDNSIKWAEERHVPIVFIETKSRTTEEIDRSIILEIEGRGGDYVFLIGWMKFIGSAFLKKFENKIINIHPSLLPDFGGLMDWKVHEAVLAAFKKLNKWRHRRSAKRWTKKRAKKFFSGCTLHFVDETVDGGPIILQKKVRVYISDTAASLRKRVQEAEIKVIMEAVKLLMENRITVEGKKVIILPKPAITGEKK